MNGQETMTALAAIADGYAARFIEQAAALDKTAKMEKKALMIERNMAVHCKTFALMKYDGNIYPVREKMVFRQYHYFDDYRAAFDALTGDARESFLVFAHAVTMIRGCFYDRHNAALDSAGDAGEIFENRLICGVLGQILADWRDWWKENGCIDCGGLAWN